MQVTDCVSITQYISWLLEIILRRLAIELSRIRMCWMRSDLCMQGIAEQVLLSISSALLLDWQQIWVCDVWPYLETDVICSSNNAAATSCSNPLCVT